MNTETLRLDLRAAADWINDNRPHQPMNDAGRLAGALVAAQAAHPGNEQAANAYMEQLLKHMPAINPVLSRAQYAADLHTHSWRI